MAYTPRVGSRVRYRSSDGRVRSARVVALGTGDQITVLVGSSSNGSVIADLDKQTTKGSTVGWLRGGR